MSETPRTDRARLDEHDPAVSVASECSKLERELNAANAIIQQQQLLDEENLRLKERIKELELKADELQNLKKWLEGR